MSFDSVFAETLALEGGYSANPADPGGATKWGVTERVARANGYRGDMRELPIEEARRIAKAQYWDVLRLDDIDRLSAPVAQELFDTGYNMGVGTAGRMLQRALNALNRQAADYPDVTEDGVVGPMTVQAMRAFLDKRAGQGAHALLKLLNVLQGAAYVEIVERRPQSEQFLLGWILNRVKLS